MEAGCQQSQSDAALLQAEMEHHRSNIARVEQELKAQQDRSGGIAGQIAGEQEKMQTAQQELVAVRQKLSGAQAEGQKLSAASAELAQKLVSVGAQQSLIQTQCASLQAQIVSMEASVEEVQERRAMLCEDQKAAQARQTQIAVQQADCRKRLSQAQEDVQSAKNTIAGYELRLKTRQDKRDSLQKQALAAGVELDTIDSRIRMLQELERDYEGFSKAVRLVMQDAAAGKLHGVHGPLSKLIHVEDQYTTAIETALGAAMQNLVVSSEEDGKAAIQMLKRRDGGRATFLPLTAIRAQSLQDTTCQRQPGFISVASGLVACEPQYRAVVENALGRTVICDTLDHAVTMARACGNRVRIVTLDGQVMNAGGSMTGGSATRSAGVLTRANTLQRLQQERGALAEKLEDLRRQAADAASSAAKTEFEMTAVCASLREAEDEVLRRTEEQKQVQLLVSTVEDNLDSIEKELARLCFDLSDLMEGMRSGGVIGLGEAGSVVLETNGSLSVFPSADKRPATRGEMHLPPVYDGIPLTLILDGQMQERSMRIAGLEPGWLRRILQDHGVARDKDVLIATLDTQGSLLVQEKGEEGRLLTFNVIEPGQVRW